MGQFRLTLLELHGDLNVGPKSLGFDSDETEEPTDEQSATGGDRTTDDGTGTSGIALLVGVIFLAVLGLAVKRRRDDADEATVEQPVELAESDEL